MGVAALDKFKSVGASKRNGIIAAAVAVVIGIAGLLLVNSFAATAQPPTPIGAKALTGGDSIAFVWRPNNDAKIKTYEVYRNGVKVATNTVGAGLLYSERTGTVYIDKNVAKGTSYNYQVRAVDQNGIASELTSTVKATHPTNSAPIPNVTVDASKATDLTDYLNTYIVPQVKTWYPKMANAVAYPDYTPRNNIRIYMDPSNTGVAVAYWRDGMAQPAGTVSVNPAWLRNNKGEFDGTIRHETLHMIQAYPNDTTKWATEGMANWADVGISQVRYGDFYPLPYQKLTDGYSVSAHMIEWGEKKYPGFARKLNVALNKNQYSEAAFKSWAGGQTPDQLYNEARNAYYGLPTGQPITGPGGKCIDIASGSTALGARVQLWPCNNNVAQKFSLLYKDAGLYGNTKKKFGLINSSIGTTAAENRCLDLKGSALTAGTPLISWACSLSEQQTLTFGPSSSIINTKTGLCLDTADGTSNNGVELAYASCNGGDSQRWKTVNSPKEEDTTSPEVSAPGAPTSLTATPKADNGNYVQVEWKTGTGIAPAKYIVYRDGKEFATSTTLKFWDTQVQNGVSYRYSVKAVGANGKESALSAEVTAKVGGSDGSTTPPAPTAPATPVNVGVRSGNVDGTTASLSWQAGTGGTATTGYNVFRNGVKISTVSSLTYTDTNLSKGVSYKYQLQAVDASGKTSAMTSEAAYSVPSGTTQPPTEALPGVPTGAQTRTGGVNIAVTWKAPSSGTAPASYNVYRNGTKVATTKPDSTTISTYAQGRTYVDKSVTAGQAYSYQIESVNASGGVSAKTAAVSATQPAASATTAAPNVAIDTSTPSEFNTWINNTLKPEFQIWYPKFVDYLARGAYATPTTVNVKVDPNYTGYAYVNFANGGNTMVIGADYARTDGGKRDVGLELHELIHIIQQGDTTKFDTERMPRWGTEGTAEWMVSNFNLSREYTVTTTHTYNSYNDYYRAVSFFFNKVQQVKSTALRELNIVFKNNTYNPYTFIQGVTGKTPKQFWLEVTGVKIEVQDNGIVRSGNNLCLEMPNSDSANKKPVAVNACNGLSSQKWNFVYNKDSSDTGSLHLIGGAPQGDGKCLDIDSSGTAENTTVQIYDCNGSIAQTWQKRSDGNWVNPNSGKCLQTRDKSTAGGAGLVIATCANVTTQKWNGVSPGGQIINKTSGVCLTNNNGASTNYNRIFMYQCTGGNGHYFALVNNANGTKALMTAGKCATVTGAATTNNTKVVLFDCKNNIGQDWVPQSDGSIKNPNSNKCLTPTNNSSANATDMVIFDCASGNAAQKFYSPSY